MVEDVRVPHLSSTAKEYNYARGQELRIYTESEKHWEDQE